MSLAKRFLFLIIIFILIIELISCSEIDVEKESLPDYAALELLSDEYEIENAINDNCVVFLDSHLIYGENLWYLFLDKSEKNQSCCVRVANYKSEGNKLYLYDIIFSETTYQVRTDDGLSRKYKFMNRYEIGTGSDYIVDCYVLVNQKNISYAEIEKSMISATASEVIDHYVVYLDIKSNK